MRILGITIEAFRGFNVRRTLDTDGDVVIIYGDNGSGKTSLFDALEWCLFGGVERLGGSRDFVGIDPTQNVFAERRPFVSVKLYDDKLGHLEISREGRKLSESQITLIGDKLRLTDEQAQEYIQKIIPTDKYSTLTYLAQETLSKFIWESPRQRFEILSKTFGLTLFSEFRQALRLEIKRQKEILSKRRTKIEIALAKLAGERESLEKRIATLTERFGSDQSSVAFGNLRSIWLEIDKEIGDLFGSEDYQPAFIPESLMKDLAFIRDSIVKLDRSRRTIERQRREYYGLLRKLPEIEKALEEQERLRTEHDREFGSLNDINKRIKKIDSTIEHQNATISEILQERSKRESELDDLRRFLQLAKEFVVSDRCPVCGQGIRKSKVHRDLDEHLGEIGIELDKLRTVEARELGVLKINEGERRALDHELALKKSKIDRLEADLSRVEHRLSESKAVTERNLRTGADVSKLKDELYKMIMPFDEESQKIMTFAPKLESIEAALDLVGSKLELDQVARKSDSEERHISASNREIARLTTVVKFLQTIMSKSRRGEIRTINETLDQYHLTLNQMYKRIEPHPLFREMSVKFREIEAGGEVYFRVKYQSYIANIHQVLSQAQLNIVALCIFLALNLALEGSTYPILLDDPVQSMDDVNAVSLADILRHIGRNKQVIVATHDEDFFEVLSDKFGPKSSAERRLRVVLKIGDTSGPGIESQMMEYAESPTLKELAVAGTAK